VRYGYRRLHVLLKREGWRVNHKTVQKIYLEEGLSLRKKRRRKRSAVLRVERPTPTTPNQYWSMDFVHDELVRGRRMRCLTLVDHFSRECPAIEVDVSMTAHCVVRVLNRLALIHGLPEVILVDNGTEVTSKAFDQWAYDNGVQIDYARPGKPTDNAYIESFNGSLRMECLNLHWFTSIEEAQRTIEAWRREYNALRPHSSLESQTPTEFARNYNKTETSQVANL
jgi:putative transposase